MKTGEWAIDIAQRIMVICELSTQSNKPWVTTPFCSEEVFDCVKLVLPTPCVVRVVLLMWVRKKNSDLLSNTGAAVQWLQNYSRNSKKYIRMKKGWVEQLYSAGTICLPRVATPQNSSTSDQKSTIIEEKLVHAVAASAATSREFSWDLQIFHILSRLPQDNKIFVKSPRIVKFLLQDALKRKNFMK